MVAPFGLAAEIDRTVLPIPESVYPPVTEIDVRNPQAFSFGMLASSLYINQPGNKVKDFKPDVGMLLDDIKILNKLKHSLKRRQ